MLVLSRKLNQSIMIGDDVRIIVVSVERDQVKLGIEAPRDVSVHRSEVYEEIQRMNRAAAQAAPPPSGDVPVSPESIAAARPRRTRRAD